MHSEEIAILIPTHNRKEHLVQCLNMLLDQTILPKNIIIIDDGSTDGTTDILRSKFNFVEIIKGNGELWWTGAVNRGIEYVLKNLKTVKGVILLNDDVVILKDWFENFVKDIAVNKHSLIGCVNVNYKDKCTITWAGKKHNNKWLSLSTNNFVGENVSLISLSHRYINSFDLIGRGLFIPCEVFKKVGLFDEKHFKHRGDTELPLRARLNGFKLIVSFNTIIYNMPEETAKIDIKKRYGLRDFKYKFFDFRSSSFWKYRYYYTKIYSNNFIHHGVLFAFSMLCHLFNYVRRLKYLSIPGYLKDKK